ncbi:hypothetical protein ScPMuIL_015654 [Solemya velum]
MLEVEYRVLFLPRSAWNSPTGTPMPPGKITLQNIPKEDIYLQMENPSSQLEIPFWVDGTQKWVTGITKRTTCDDVIYSLLYHDDKQEKSHKYAVHERWREVERPLQGRTKIMKIWNAWGPEQLSVQFVMRRTDNIDFMGESVRTRRRYRKSRGKSRDVRDRHHRNKQSRHNNSEHPSEKVTIMENLVKLIISQERMLTDITGRLSDTESVIDKFENKLHLCRLEQNGENYVQSAYLDSLSEDSMDDFLQKVDINHLETYLNFCDRIIQLEGDITMSHSQIQDLSVQIQESFIESSNSQQSNAGMFYEEELIKLQAELNRVVSSNIMQQYKSDEMTKELDYYDQQISIKRARIENLEEELSRFEHESYYENVHATPIQPRERQVFFPETVMNGVHYENVLCTNEPENGVTNNMNNTQGTQNRENSVGFRDSTASDIQGNRNDRECRTNIAKKFSTKNNSRKREDHAGVCRTNSMPHNQTTKTPDQSKVNRTNSVSGCAKLLRSVHAQNHRTNTVRFQKENKENHEESSGYENVIFQSSAHTGSAGEKQNIMTTNIPNGFHKDIMSRQNVNVEYVCDAGKNVKPQVLMKTFVAENVPKMTEPLYTNVQFETRVPTTHLSNLRGDILNVSKVDDNDSNSDTGLSSMHSDESITYLETLV